MVTIDSHSLAPLHLSQLSTGIANIPDVGADTLIPSRALWSHALAPLAYLSKPLLELSGHDYGYMSSLKSSGVAESTCGWLQINLVRRNVR